MAGKVLVIGSVTADINIYVDHIPEKEEDVNVERQTLFLMQFPSELYR